MTLMDPIGDMFTRIRNGQLRLLKKVEMPSSNFRLKVLDVLKNEGFISSYHIEKKDNNKVSLVVELKYYEGTPVIKEIKRVSKPGRRVFSSATSIPRIQNGLGLAIISTNKGVMSDIEARKNNVGGEIICRVF
jgi:small subunit ribosomal protein S8